MRTRVRAAAEDAGFNIRGAVIIDPEKYENMEAMVAKMVELRKGKMTEDEVRAALKKSNYFGTMLVAMGEADALLGGATYSTADTVRPRPAAGEDQARQQDRLLLLHPGPPLRHRRQRRAGHGRLRHQHQAQ